MIYPLRVRKPTPGIAHRCEAAIVDRYGRVIAVCPPHENMWTWADTVAPDIVERANAEWRLSLSQVASVATVHAAHSKSR